MIFAINHGQPWAAVQLHFGGGSANDPEGLDGRAYLTAQMLLRGTEQRDQAEWVEAIETLGGDASALVGRESLVLEVEGLSRHLSDLMSHLGEAIAMPLMDAEEVERLKRQTIAEIEERRDSDEELIQHVFARLLLEPDPASRPVSGTAESLARITPDDLWRCWRDTFVWDNALAAWAGDVTEADARAIYDDCIYLKPGPAASKRAIAPVTPPGRRVVLLDKPDRDQTQLAIGHACVPAGHPDMLALEVANAAFGGLFTSRLSQEIREKRGWSYGVWSYLDGQRSHGTFGMRLHPAAPDAVDALAVALDLLAALIADGIDDDELEMAKSALINQVPFRLQTPRKQLADAIRCHLLELPPDDTHTRPHRLDALTRAEVNAAIGRHLSVADLAIVGVCTANEIAPAMSRLAGVSDITVHPWSRDWPQPRS